MNNTIETFGNVTGMNKAMKDVNFYLATGNQKSEKFEELEKDLLDKLALNGVMSPKKAVKMRHLFKNDQVETEEYKGLAAEKETAIKQFKVAIGVELQKWIRDTIGENKKLVLASREKILSKRGNTVNKMDMPYTPMELQFFDNPLKDKEASSVYMVQATTDVTDITNQMLVKLGVGSVCYDEKKHQYVTHQWIFTYDVVAETITAEKTAELEKELDEMDSIL